MDTNSYVVFLLIGAILVAVDGQIIYRSGRKYLEHSYSDPAAAASATRLISGLFHLAVLGVLMLISTIDVGASQIEGVVIRLGVVLLVLAVAHGITMTILSRMRERLQNERLFEEQAAVRNEHEAVADPTVVEPTIDPKRPFPTAP